MLWLPSHIKKKVNIFCMPATRPAKLKFCWGLLGRTFFMIDRQMEIVSMVLSHGKTAGGSMAEESVAAQLSASDEVTLAATETLVETTWKVSVWKMGFGSQFPMALNWLQGKDTESHKLRLWSIIQLRNWVYEISCFVALTRLQMCLQDKIKGNCCLFCLKCPSFWPSQVYLYQLLLCWEMALECKMNLNTETEKNLSTFSFWKWNSVFSSKSNLPLWYCL